MQEVDTNTFIAGHYCFLFSTKNMHDTTAKGYPSGGIICAKLNYVDYNIVHQLVLTGHLKKQIMHTN